MMRLVFVLAAVFVSCSRLAWGDDAWQVVGDVQAIKPGTPEIVVFRLADGRTIEVPFDALTATSQAAARRVAAGSPQSASESPAQTGPVLVKGPFGRPVRIAVPESIKDIETDAIRCRSAREAADVYRLALANAGLSREQRAAAEARLREWSDLSDKSVVRLGDRWVSSDDSRIAAEEAEKIVGHALELLRVGNADLAEDELRKAAKVDPESGRAGFVAGLAYAVVGKNYAKAVEHFTDAAGREPDDASILANLGALELLTRRYAMAAEHFGDAVECAIDRLPVAESVAWAVKLAGAAKVNPNLGKYRMPDRTVEELNALYRILSQSLKLRPMDVTEEPRFLGPDGTVCTATTLTELAALFEAAVPPSPTRHVFGFVVAPGHILCPRDVLVERDGSTTDTVWVSLPADRVNRWSATVVSAPADADVALLACEGLTMDPLAIGDRAEPGADVQAVDRANDSWIDVQPRAISGKIVESGSQAHAAGRFIHSAVGSACVAGGPIVDAKGRVVGMVAATPSTETSRLSAGFGIPIDGIRESLGKAAGLFSTAGSEGGKSPATAEQRALAATVIVSSARQEPQLKVSDVPPPQ